MDFALVIATEVNETVSELLRQGDDILPQGLQTNGGDGIGVQVTQYKKEGREKRGHYASQG